MHVAFLNMPIEFYSPVSGGAIATVIMQTSRALITNGHKVSVLTPVNGDETYSVGEVIPIAARTRDDLHFLQRRLSSLRWRLLRWDWPYFEYYLRSAMKTLGAMRDAPDVIVVFNDLVSPKYLKRQLPRAKVVVWLQNEWRTRQDMQETERNTDLFVACSDYIRQWTARTYNIPPSRFVVAHNSADNTVFTPRADYLNGGDTLRVLFLGRIDPNKGPDLVADAVATLRAEGLPVTLTVGGGLWFYGHGNEMENPYFRELKSKMEAADANYVGHVNRHEAPELYREHDVVCVLSRSQDPFPLVTMEAMASGCAVVASRRGGLPEACTTAGILVEPDNFPEVVGALRALAIDRELLNSQKNKSLARAAEVPWKLCAETLQEAFR